MSEVLGRLNAAIEAQGPDQLWVDARDALTAAYQTISDLRVEVDAALESARNYRSEAKRTELLSDDDAARIVEAANTEWGMPIVLGLRLRGIRLARSTVSDSAPIGCEFCTETFVNEQSRVDHLCDEHGVCGHDD